MQRDAALLLPLDTIDNPASYRGQGRIRVTEARVAGLILEPLELGVKLAGLELQFDNFQANLQTGGACGVNANVELKAPFAYVVHLRPAGVDFKALEQLTTSLRPAVQLTGRLASRGCARQIAAFRPGNAGKYHPGRFKN